MLQDGILFNKAGTKRSISYYTTKVMKDFMDMNMKSGITSDWRIAVNVSLSHTNTHTHKISILRGDTLWKLPPSLLAGMFKCYASQLFFPVDFSAFSVSITTQNV